MAEKFMVDGIEMTQSAYIRKLFKEDKSRKEIAEITGAKYHTVYAATANMYNAKHVEGESTSTGRASVMVPKIDVNGSFVGADAEGNEIIVESADDALMVPRTTLMKELYDNGVERKDIAAMLDVKYATVYAATNEGGGTATRHMITHPQTGEEIKRNDYIRELFATGMDRKAIALELTKLTGDLVDYATVWAATKPKKVEEEVAATEETAQEDSADENVEPTNEAE